MHNTHIACVDPETNSTQVADRIQPRLCATPNPAHRAGSELLTCADQLLLRRVPEGIPAGPPVQLTVGQQAGAGVARMLLQSRARPPEWGRKVQQVSTAAWAAHQWEACTPQQSGTESCVHKDWPQ